MFQKNLCRYRALAALSSHVAAGARMPSFTRFSSSALLLVGALIMTSFHAQAQSSFNVGQRLGTAQLQQLDTLSTVKIDGTDYRILGTGTNSAQIPYTQLVGKNGVVGQSFHEVMVSGQPVDALRQKLPAAAGSAQTIKYYEGADMALLRYADITQAAAGLQAIRSALPQATVSLPISYSPTQPR